MENGPFIEDSHVMIDLSKKWWIFQFATKKITKTVRFFRSFWWPDMARPWFFRPNPRTFYRQIHRQLQDLLSRGSPRRRASPLEVWKMAFFSTHDSEILWDINHNGILRRFNGISWRFNGILWNFIGFLRCFFLIPTQIVKWGWINTFNNIF